jgi:hypothetical protein
MKILFIIYPRTYRHTPLKKAAVLAVVRVVWQCCCEETRPAMALRRVQSGTKNTVAPMHTESLTLVYFIGFCRVAFV